MACSHRTIVVAAGLVDTLKGAGRRLCGMRLAIASSVRAIRSAGSSSAALPNMPSLSRSRRLSSIRPPQASGSAGPTRALYAAHDRAGDFSADRARSPCGSVAFGAR